MLSITSLKTPARKIERVDIVLHVNVGGSEWLMVDGGNMGVEAYREGVISGDIVLPARAADAHAHQSAADAAYAASMATPPSSAGTTPTVAAAYLEAPFTDAECEAYFMEEQAREAELVDRLHERGLPAHVIANHVNQYVPAASPVAAYTRAPMPAPAGYYVVDGIAYPIAPHFVAPQMVAGSYTGPLTPPPAEFVLDRTPDAPVSTAATTDARKKMSSGSWADDVDAEEAGKPALAPATKPVSTKLAAKPAAVAAPTTASAKPNKGKTAHIPAPKTARDVARSIPTGRQIVDGVEISRREAQRRAVAAFHEAEKRANASGNTSPTHATTSPVPASAAAAPSRPSFKDVAAAAAALPAPVVPVSAPAKKAPAAAAASADGVHAACTWARKNGVTTCCPLGPTCPGTSKQMHTYNFRFAQVMPTCDKLHPGRIGHYACDSQICTRGCRGENTLGIPQCPMEHCGRDHLTPELFIEYRAWDDRFIAILRNQAIARKLGLDDLIPGARDMSTTNTAADRKLADLQAQAATTNDPASSKPARDQPVGYAPVHRAAKRNATASASTAAPANATRTSADFSVLADLNGSAEFTEVVVARKRATSDKKPIVNTPATAQVNGIPDADIDIDIDAAVEATVEATVEAPNRSDSGFALANGLGSAPHPRSPVDTPADTPAPENTDAAIVDEVIVNA